MLRGDSLLPIDKKAFGKRLKQARTDRNLTLEMVAESTGLAPGSISRYESGNRLPHSEPLRKLAWVYGKSMDWLIGESPVGIREPTGEYLPSRATRYGFPEMADLEDALNNATDDQRAKLLGLVSGIAALVEGKD